MCQVDVLFTRLIKDSVLFCYFNVIMVHAMLFVTVDLTFFVPLHHLL